MAESGRRGGQGRVVTLTGLGGIGKSELAKAIADESCGQAWAKDGVHYVDLQNATNSDAIVSALVTGLGLQPVTHVGALAQQLGGPRLYILDDCYQAISSDRRGVQVLVRTLHDYTSPARFLLTSRELVGLPDLEHPYPLDRLPSPYDADLFRAVAQSVHYMWHAGDEERQATLLRALDGYPLALVLAAHLLYDSSLEGVLKRWQNRRTAALTVPGTADQDLDKLTSVDFSLAMSYDALPVGEARTLFALFAYLPGGATAETLEAMLGGSADEAVRFLVRRSLVQWRDKRYVMLVPVHEFATRFLSDACEPYRHALDDHWLVFTRRWCADDAMWIRRQGEAVRFLTTELPNLHAAMDRAEARMDHHLLTDMTNALSRFYPFARPGTEAMQQLRRGATAAQIIGYQLSEATCILSLGDVHRGLAEYPLARARYEEALQLYRDIGDRRGEANCIRRLGEIHHGIDEYLLARARYEEALQLSRDIGDRRGETASIQRLGDVHRGLAEYLLARARYEEALQLSRDIGDRRGEAASIVGLSDVHRMLAEYPLARARYEEALQLSRDIGEREGEADCIFGLGDVHRGLAEYPLARARHEEALQLSRDIGEREGEADCIFGLGDVHRGLAEYPLARARYEEALQLSRDIGDRRGEADCIFGLGDVHRGLAEYPLARARYEEALQLYRDIGNRYRIADVFWSMGHLCAAAGERQEAVRWIEQAVPLFEKAGATLQANRAQEQAKAWRNEESADRGN